MFKKIKTLLSPIRFIKKDFSIFLAVELFDWFQSVFVVQILALIVGTIQSKNLGEFYFYLRIFIGVMIIAIVWNYLSKIYFAKTFSKLAYILTDIYLAKFIKLDNNKIENLWTWRANSIILKWLDNWCAMIIEDFVSIIINMTSIAYAFLLILFTVWVQYFLFVVFVFILMISISYYWTSATLKKRMLRKDLQTEFDRWIIKIIMSKFEILQNNRFRKESDNINDVNNKIIDVWTKEEMTASNYMAIVMVISALVRIFIFIFIWIWVIKWTYSLSYFILVNWLVNVIDQYMWSTRRIIRSVGIHIAWVDKLIETFDNIEEIHWINNPTPFTYSKWNIKINSLTYWYWEDNIFNSFSLDIVWQKKTALVWDSWSGKTTLMKLIAWYIHPKEWEINVDNQNIQDINLISYYKNIWYLTQDPSVFDWTIIENLTYALDREPTQLEIDTTIKSSKCEFIYELPNWMDTEIWERWIKLSGWQKQRLAIAKIMLKNPNIILLDEPTSALDSISEQIVSEAFHNLFAGRTVIVIAHRLQTVKEADDIIVMKKWEIIERWTHESLSKIKDWEYKKMLDLQTSF